MTAAWFQSITSEKGSSHPLLSITGTQAACSTQGHHSVSGTRTPERAQGSHQHLTVIFCTGSEPALVKVVRKEHQNTDHRRATQILMVFQFALIHTH